MYVVCLCAAYFRYFASEFITLYEETILHGNEKINNGRTIFVCAHKHIYAAASTCNSVVRVVSVYV